MMPTLLKSSELGTGKAPMSATHHVKSGGSVPSADSYGDEFEEMKAHVQDLSDQLALLLEDHSNLSREVRQLGSAYKRALSRESIVSARRSTRGQEPRAEQRKDSLLGRVRKAIQRSTSSASVGQLDRSSSSQIVRSSSAPHLGGSSETLAINAASSSLVEEEDSPKGTVCFHEQQRLKREQRRQREREQRPARLRVLVPEDRVDEVNGRDAAKISTIARRTGTSLTFARNELRPGLRILTVEQQATNADVPSAALQALTAANPKWQEQGAVAQVLVLLPRRLESLLAGRLGRHLMQVAKSTNASINIRQPPKQPEQTQTEQQAGSLALALPVTRREDREGANDIEVVVKGSVEGISRLLMSLEWVEDDAGSISVARLPVGGPDGKGGRAAGAFVANATDSFDAYSESSDGCGYNGNRSVGGGRNRHRQGGHGGGTEEEMQAAAERRERFEEEQRQVERNMNEFGLTKERLVDSEKAAIDAAKWEKRGTCQGCLLNVVSSIYFQAVSLSCIVLNLAVTWVEVDASEGSDQQRQAELVQYVLTIIFFLEAVLNLTVIPQAWRHKDITIDALVVGLAFVLETTYLTQGAGREVAVYLPFLLLIRLMRFGRLLRRFRNYRGFRAIRVIVAGVSGTLMNLFWITVTLCLIFYTGGIVFRTLLKSAVDDVGNGPVDAQDFEVEAIARKFFPSVLQSCVTLFEVFIEAYQYSEITQPLLESEKFLYVGYLWVIYQVFMKVCVFNLVTGLFIEQLIRAAAKSDQAAQKEQLAMQNLDYSTLLTVFHKMDRDGDGVITLVDFEEALLQEREVDEVLHHAGPSGQWDARTYFESLDARGQGQLSFSDFCYGVVKQRCGTHSLDQLVFDHQVKTVVRQSSQSYTEVWDANAAVQNSAAKVESISKFLGNQRSRHSHEMQHIRGKLNVLQKKIDSIFTGLDIRGGESFSQTQKSLVSVANVREAKKISEVMQGLRTALEQASVTANKQSGSAYTFAENTFSRFRKDIDSEVRKQLEIIRAEGVAAAEAASAAAVAAKAAVHSASAIASAARCEAAVQSAAATRALELHPRGV